jgi:hypothetical protein
MSLTPVPSESATCANCSAPLVADQRYCLSCGQPCSPVRLAFLDVLQAESQPQAAPRPPGTTPVAYAPLLEPSATPGWLRRYSPLFGVLSVLLMAMIIGLLVGHWVTQSKAPSEQVLKVEGLSGAPLASAATTTPTTATTPAAGTTSKSSAKAEAKEAAQEAKAEKAVPPPAKPVKVSSSGLQKLGSSTGKKHEEEVNKLGNQPIETGGGGSSSTPSSSSTEASKSIGGGSKVESIE